ncbi:hypothetical protein Pla144_05400 [Bythopirellula polymerisocia]|nr:hypothetical protein Pla144_05400 [Bythopirellula polymerisocia]
MENGAPQAQTSNKLRAAPVVLWPTDGTVDWSAASEPVRTSQFIGWSENLCFAIVIIRNQGAEFRDYF